MPAPKQLTFAEAVAADSAAALAVVQATVALQVAEEDVEAARENQRLAYAAMREAEARDSVGPMTSLNGFGRAILDNFWAGRRCLEATTGKRGTIVKLAEPSQWPAHDKPSVWVRFDGTPKAVIRETAALNPAEAS